MKHVPSEMVGLYCGIGALASLSFHIFFETFVMPSNLELFLCVTMGFAGGGLAYQLWDLGIKFGNLTLLNTSTYLARVLAMLLLTYLEKSIITPMLILSSSITILAVILSSIDLSKKNFEILKKKCLRYVKKTHHNL
jgi:drug/metabolite transporter (DMT)-like permease